MAKSKLTNKTGSLFGKKVIKKKVIDPQKKASMIFHANVYKKKISSLIIPGRLLALDVSLQNTGALIFTEQGLVLRSFTLKHSLSFKKCSENEKQRLRTDRTIVVSNEIVSVCKTFNIKHVVMEGFSYGSKFQAHQLGEMQGVVKSQLLVNFRIVPIIVQPKEGRKVVFGYGGSNQSDIKDTIMDILINNLGIYQIEDDHQSDACVVGLCCFGSMGIKESV